MDVLCHLTGLHFPSPSYHSSQNVSLTFREGREREWEREILKEINYRDKKKNKLRKIRKCIK